MNTEHTLKVLIVIARILVVHFKNMPKNACFFERAYKIEASIREENMQQTIIDKI